MSKLRKARLRVDISQLELMKRSGIHYSVISKIEKGWFDATEEQKKKLSEALEIDSNLLFSSNKEEK